ncbi:MAG: hypothetical protein Q8Q92_03390 [bacterium]|nr:hypothetical protein [bacterium]
MNEQKDEVTKTLNVVKKFFAKGSPLSEELKAFRTLLNSHVKSSETAQKILSEVCKFTKTLSAKNIDKQKSLLLKEINYHLDAKTIFSYRIPEFRTYATVQVLFNNARSKGNPLDNVERYKLEESIIERLTTGKIEEKTDMLKINPKFNNLIHKFATKRFTEKYRTVLSEDQKLLLTKYAASLLSESDKSFKVYVLGEVEKIKQGLTNIKDVEIVKDHQLMGRIQEGKEKLLAESFDVMNDEKVVRLLQFMALLQEIK